MIGLMLIPLVLVNDIAQLTELGFEISATRGTCRTIAASGIDCQVVNKVKEGRPHIVDMIKNDDFVLIINTTEGKQAIKDGKIYADPIQFPDQMGHKTIEMIIPSITIPPCSVISIKSP